MEYTRFVGVGIHKERISIAVAESGRSGAVEYLGDVGAPSLIPTKAGDWVKTNRRDSTMFAIFIGPES